MPRNRWATRRTVLRSGVAAAGLLGAGTRVGTAQSDEPCYYQIDFVAGEPIKTLGASEDAFYGRQNRLIQYAHADGHYVIKHDTWINSLDPEIRRCVTADPIDVGNGNVSVEFTVADECERTVSLAVYPLPGGEFSFERRQELAAATTETVGPGTHELTVGGVLGTVCPPPPGDYERLAKFIPDDPATGAHFGRSVAVSGSGETAIVGSSYDDTDAGDDAGSAYVFSQTNGTWTQRAKLTAADATHLDYFGSSVGMSDSGDTAIVGSPRDDNNAGEDAGSAYVFDRTNNGWTQRAKLLPDDTEGDNNFGESVTLSSSGEIAVVGASWEDGSSGAAYVFGRANEGWTKQAKLTAADAAASDYFGASVAVSGSGRTVVVGAWGDDDAGRFSGSAYVFDRINNSWTQQAKLTAADATSNDIFGWSVAVSDSGERVVVGAHHNTGSADVFERTDDGWTQRAELTPADPAQIDYFGSSVAMSDSGEMVVFGVYYGDSVGAESGSVHVFGRANGTWNQQAKLTAYDDYDRFGWSVAVSGSGETVAVGADQDDDAGPGSGSAYVFGR